MNRKIALREFPFPYRAVLSISNDIDATSWDDFIAIHGVFTELGLQLADSFFIYQVPGAGEYAFSYADYPSLLPSRRASTLKSMIDGGRIDTFHTLGNHSREGGFTRETALRAAKTIRRDGLSCAVWTNHGDADNRQNICSGWGDDPTSEEYCSDLLGGIGVRFLWVGGLSPYVGQGRRLGLKDTYLNPALHPSRTRRYLGLLRYCIKRVVTRSDPLDHSINELLYPITLRDGGRFWAFRRFGFWDRAMRDDLPRLLSARTLKTLAARGGYLVVYIHLGKKRRRDDTLFTDEERGALVRLGDCQSRGSILVTTTGRLLEYATVHRGLTYQVKELRGRFVIDITMIRDPVSGDFIPDSRLLRGVTFYTPCVEKTAIRVNNLAVRPVSLWRTSDGGGYIGIPWKT